MWHTPPAASSGGLPVPDGGKAPAPASFAPPPATQAETQAAAAAVLSLGLAATEARARSIFGQQQQQQQQQQQRAAVTGAAPTPTTKSQPPPPLPHARRKLVVWHTPPSSPIHTSTRGPTPTGGTKLSSLSKGNKVAITMSFPLAPVDNALGQVPMFTLEGEVEVGSVSDGNGNDSTPHEAQKLPLSPKGRRLNVWHTRPDSPTVARAGSSSPVEKKVHVIGGSSNLNQRVWKM